jgi:hypothetical protein
MASQQGFHEFASPTKRRKNENDLSSPTKRRNNENDFASPTKRGNNENDCPTQSTQATQPLLGSHPLRSSNEQNVIRNAPWGVLYGEGGLAGVLVG